MVAPVPRELQGLASLRFHDKNLVVALIKTGVSNPLAIGRPAWLCIIIPRKGNTSNRFCLYIHDINLRIAAAVGCKGDMLAIRRPGWGYIKSGIFCKSVENGTFSTYQVEIGIAVYTKSDDHGFTVRRPGWCKVQTGTAGNGPGRFSLLPVGDVEVRVTRVIGGIGKQFAVMGEFWRDRQVFMPGYLLDVSSQDIC